MTQTDINSNENKKLSAEVELCIEGKGIDGVHFRQWTLSVLELANHEELSSYEYESIESS